MIKKNAQKILRLIGSDAKTVAQRINTWSIKLALTENGFGGLIEKLRKIVPDISNQESSEKDAFNDNIELKRRCLQAFQCTLMLKAIENLSPSKLMVVDIGDSAGTHMIYLQELIKDKFSVDTLSINLDPRAITKIKVRGLKAMLSRAEDLDLRERDVHLFTSFEMVEHLHSPAIFFRRLARNSKCNKIVITVPYLRNSRVGLHHIRNKTGKVIYAEDEHIFELSPKDWTLLMLHSGWKVIHSEIYYQYPRRWPLINQILAAYWRTADFEGFWGAVLERDATFSDLYQDWEPEFGNL